MEEDGRIEMEGKDREELTEGVRKREEGVEGYKGGGMKRKPRERGETERTKQSRNGASNYHVRTNKARSEAYLELVRSARQERRDFGEEEKAKKMSDSASGMELINLLAMEGHCERSPQRYFNERNLTGERGSLSIYAKKSSECEPKRRNCNDNYNDDNGQLTISCA